MYPKLDKLYFSAAKNQVAQAELVNELLNLGKLTCISILKKLCIYNVQYEDLEDYVLSVANTILTKYSKDKGTFTDFATYTFKKRLSTKIVNTCTREMRKVFSLDATLEDGTPYLELIEDKNLNSIPDEISLDELKFLISSPKSGDTKIARLARKIYKLFEIGYTVNEVMQMYNLTYGQVRYLKNYINDELENIKNKMEIK